MWVGVKLARRIFKAQLLRLLTNPMQNPCAKLAFVMYLEDGEKNLTHDSDFLTLKQQNFKARFLEISPTQASMAKPLPMNSIFIVVQVKKFLSLME